MPVSEVTAPNGTVLEVTHPEGATEDQILAYAKEQYQPEEQQGIGESITRGGAGMASEIAVGEGGKIGGAALGTAFLGPGIGTLVGYTVGGLGSGAAGSIARQKLMHPDGEISWGEVVADSLINIIPAGKATKSGRFIYRAGREALKGAAMGGAIGEAGLVVEKAIEEQTLPSPDEFKQRGITASLVGAGFGMAGETFSRAYSKFAGMPSHKLTDAYKSGDPDAKIIVDGIERTAEDYSKSIRKVYGKEWDRLRENWSDELTRARELQTQSGGGQYVNKNGMLEVVSDETDYYMQRRLAEATIQNHNKQIAETIDLDGKFLQTKSKDLDIPIGDLSDSVDDYLYAKHALSYNKELGDEAAGISNEAAQSIINKFEKAGFHDQLAPSITMRSDSSRKILDVLVDGGLVAPTMATALRKKYPDYVPLNRIMDGVDIDEQLIAPLAAGSTKYEAKNTGLRIAKGSEREVKNITQNIYENLAGAVRRAEVNKANLAFRKLLDANPDHTIAKVRKPKKIGEIKMGDKTLPLMEHAPDNAMTVFDLGQKFFVEFKDPSVARAFKGMNRENLNAPLRMSYGFNRFIGGLLTRWNPGFLAPNLVRDRVEATVNNLAKMDTLTALKTLNPVNDMNTIERNLRGTTPRNDKEIQLDALYNRFREAGGSSGGLGLSTVQHIEDEIAKMAKNLRTPPNQTAQKFTQVVNGINEVFEDATRFGTFRRGVESGMSDQQAALAARDSSFDPLLQGAKGDQMKALWMFSNPALQSVKNFTRSMTKGWTGAGVMTGLLGINLAVDQWNQRYDPDWREKLKTSDGSNWKTNKHMVLIHGKEDDGTLKYASIPIGYSVVPFKVMADKAQQLMTAQEVGAPADIAKEISSEIIDAYNPMGGSIVPTMGRPLFEIAMNKDGLGRDIRPEWLETRNISAVEKVYPWTAETQGGELAMGLAEWAEGIGHEVSPETLLYLYKFGTGGPGKTVERLLDVTSKLWNGEQVESADIPIARRFFGQTYVQSFERRNGQKQIIDNIDKQENTNASKASRVAYSVMQTYRDAGGGAPGLKAAVSEMKGREDVDEAVLRRVVDKIESEMRGITHTDEDMMNLGVKSGARAQAYSEIIRTMQPQEAAQYMQEQMDKGILTSDVQKQLLLDYQLMQVFRNRKPPPK